MAEKSKNATSTNKCFSGFLQRIICGGSLPTHPSDQFLLESKMKIVEQKVNKDEEAIIEATIKHPGIVARLMGLDSLPEKEEDKITSFPRSRSVNSLDYMIQFNLSENIHHRRAKTSVSFRELPNILDQEFKSEFLVFCFNDDHEKTSTFQTSWGRLKKTADSSSRKNVDKCYNNRTSIIEMTKKVDVCGKQDRMSNDGLEKKLKKSRSQSQTSWGRQKKAADSCSRKNIDKCCNNIRTSSNDKTKKDDVCRKQDKNVKMKKQVKVEDYPKKMVVESNLEKKKQKSKGKYVKSTKIQPLFNSAEPTPINYISAGNERKMQLNSRRSLARVTNPEHAIASKMEKPKEISNKETDYFINVLGDICRLTEEELNESSWLATRGGGNFKFENFEDLCLYFGQEILELLLDQVVHELF